MTTPSTFQNEFNKLFSKQGRRENAKSFQLKKRKLENIDLEPRKDITVSPELFQDPELIAHISTDVYNISFKTAEKASRIRPLLEAVTDKRPQARDVKSTRVMENEQLEIVDSLEGSTLPAAVYVNPLVPRRRMYIKERSETPPSPSLSSVDQSVENSEQHSSHILQQSFYDLSKSIKQSKLNSVGPTHLSTLLYRQHEFNSFYSTMPELTQINKKKVKWNAIKQTLITVTLFVKDDATKKGQEIELLGSHSLCDLRDTIICCTDLSENTENNSNTLTMVDGDDRKYVPSIIYMDHVFYIDTRHNTHTVMMYNSKINEWLDKKKVNKEVFNYQIVEMQSALLMDLQIMLNRPFTFLHGGDCEHMFIMKDLRLLLPNEYEKITDFPRTTHTVKFVRYKCSMCTVFTATYVTTEDVLTGYSPCYFCERCYKSFHAESEYDKQYEYKTEKYYGSVL